MTRGAIGFATKTISVKALYTANATYEKKKMRTIIYNRFGYAISWTPNEKNTQAGYTIVGYKIFRRVVGDSGRFTRRSARSMLRASAMPTWALIRHPQRNTNTPCARSMTRAITVLLIIFGTVANAVLPRKLLGSEVLKNTRN